jgi:hypothetical protein
MPYARPTTAVVVAVSAGSGTGALSESAKLTVIVRVSEKTGLFAGVATFAVSTTFTVIVLAPDATVVAPLSQVSVVAAGVQVIHAGIAGVVIVKLPNPPANV